MHHAKAIRKKERLKKRKTDGEFQIALKTPTSVPRIQLHIVVNLYCQKVKKLNFTAISPL